MSFNVSLVLKRIEYEGLSTSDRFLPEALKRCSAIALEKGVAPDNVTQTEITYGIDEYEPSLPLEVETKFNQGDTIIADGNVGPIQSAFEEYLRQLGVSGQDLDSAIAKIHVWSEEENCWKQPNRNYIETE